MIWGAEEIFEMNLFFPGNPFRIKFFSSARPLKIYFFPGECLSKFIFPGEEPPKLFFLNFLWPHAEIKIGLFPAVGRK